MLQAPVTMGARSTLYLRLGTPLKPRRMPLGVWLMEMRSGKETTPKVSLNVVFPPNAGAQLVVVAVTTTILVRSAWSGIAMAFHSFVPAPVPLTLLARFSHVTGVTNGPGASADPARLRF